MAAPFLFSKTPGVSNAIYSMYGSSGKGVAPTAGPVLSPNNPGAAAQKGSPQSLLNTPGAAGQQKGKGKTLLGE